jgi:hypothetical protein
MIKNLKNIALVINNKLVVVASTNDQLKKGMVIKKINNETVSNSNICEFERLLLINSEN